MFEAISFEDGPLRWEIVPDRGKTVWLERADAAIKAYESPPEPTLLEQVAEVMHQNYARAGGFHSMAKVAIAKLREGAPERLGMFTMFSHDEPWIASRQEIIDAAFGPG